jgi:hypothetical protein
MRVPRVVGATANAAGLYSAFCDRFTVAGRSYVQGDVLLALMAGGPDVVAGGQPIPRAGSWRGTQIPLPSQQMGAGIGLAPGETVRMRVNSVIDAVRPSHIVLDCVQFPDDERDPLTEIYKRLRFQGIGEVLFAGDRTLYLASGASILFQPQPQPPNALSLNRMAVRGAQIDNTAATPTAEFGTAAAAIPGNVSALLFTSSERPPQNQAAPFRGVIGFPGYDIDSGIVNVKQNERSMVRLNFIGTSAAVATQEIFIAQQFEGADPDALVLHAANAIS